MGLQRKKKDKSKDSAGGFCFLIQALRRNRFIQALNMRELQCRYMGVDDFPKI